MKNKFIIALSSLGIFIGAAIGVGLTLGGPTTAQVNVAQRTTYRVTATATTTGNERFMSFGTGTTSLVVDTSITGELSILLQGRASSTDTNFDVWLEGSSNGQDYYPLNYPLAAVSADPATTTVTVAPSQVKFRWYPGVTSTTTKGYVLPAIDAFTRVNVAVGTSSSVTSRGAVMLRVGSR